MPDRSRQMGEEGQRKNDMSGKLPKTEEKDCWLPKRRKSVVCSTERTEEKQNEEGKRR